MLLLQSDRAEEAAFAINHTRAVVRRQRLQRPGGQHVARLRPHVAQDAVVEQVIGRAVADAQQGGAPIVLSTGQRLPGLGEEDVTRQVIEPHLFGDVPSLVEERRSERAVAEPAAKTIHHRLNFFSVGMFVSVDSPPEPLRRDRLADFLIHLHQDEPPMTAVLPVQGQDRVAGRAGAGEGVEDEGIFIRRDLKDTFDETGRFRCDKDRLRIREIQDFKQFLFGFLSVPHFLICP